MGSRGARVGGGGGVWTWTRRLDLELFGIANKKEIDEQTGKGLVTIFSFQWTFCT